MSTLNVQLPDSLYKRLHTLASKDGVSVDQFVALAVAEKISALTTQDYLQERANRGHRTAYDNVLAQVPDVEPETQDKLPSESK